MTLAIIYFYLAYGRVLVLLLAPFLLSGQCLVDQLPTPPPISKQRTTKNTGQEKVISFVYEVDYFTYSQFGNFWDTYDWAVDQYRDMASAYGDAGVSTALTNVRININPDWSSNEDDIFQLLYLFGEERANDNTGRIKMFLSMKGNFQGLAWVGGFDEQTRTFTSSNCPNSTCYFGPYSINLGMDNNPNTLWDVRVLTHEAGHNFTLRHSFDCIFGPNNDKALTSCLSPTCGTVQPPEDDTWMSYCNAGANGFGPTQGEQLRQEILNTGVDLLDGTPIILTVASDIRGSYTYSEEAVFHPNYCGTGELEVILE